MTAFATVTYTVNSGHLSTPEFSYAGIELFPNSSITHSAQLQVFRNGTLLTLTTDYTVDPATEKVTVLAAIAVSDIITIARSTDISEPIVDYTDGSSLDADTLDNANLQLLFAIQELSDTSTGTLITLNGARTAWAGLNYPTTGFSPATSASGLTTLSQVEGLIAGSEVATIDTVDEWVFVGDGSTADYTLTDAPAGLTDDSEPELWVAIDGVLQEPTQAYTLDTTGADPVITFTSNVPNGARAHIRIISGQINTTLAAGSVTTTAIADDAVTLDKIAGTAGANNRVILFNSSGVPSYSTLDHDDITDFDAGVQANALSSMTAPAANVSWAGYRITSLGTPSSSTDAATKGYVDTAIAGVSTSVVAGRVGLTGSLTTGSGTATKSFAFTPSAVVVTVQEFATSALYSVMCLVGSTTVIRNASGTSLASVSTTGSTTTVTGLGSNTVTSFVALKEG